MVVSNTIHSRIVRDPSGTVWRITERLAKDVPGAMAATCLIFDSASICRRYWSYPHDWLSLPDLQLLSLMDESRQLAH